MLLELKPYYDKRKSFYGKAIVEFNEKNNLNKFYTLYSYTTPLMTISKRYIHFKKGINYSLTTMRHIRELLRQYAGDSELQISKKDIIKYNYKLVNVWKNDIGDTRQIAIKEFNK